MDGRRVNSMNLDDDGIYIPEIVLPAQFFPVARRESAELALLRGVLEQAMDDLQQFRHARYRWKRHLYRDAYNWVASHSRAHTFTFVNVCEALHLSPTAVRSRLLAQAPRPGLLHLEEAA